MIDENGIINIPVPKKKRIRKKKLSGPRPAGSSSDDSIVFLSMFENVLTCLAYTISFNQMKKKSVFDSFGYQFYPYFNRLVINCTELSPMLLRNYNIKGIY